MSWDLNHVSLIGRLTRDPEIRYGTQGTPFATLGIAVNRRISGKDKVATNEVSYFNVVVFGKLAEICNDYLVKGKQLAVSGYLRQKRWNKNEEKFSSIEIVAEHVQFLTPSNGDGNYVKKDSYVDRPTKSKYQDDEHLNNFKKDDSEDSFDDEIPF